MLRKSLLDRVNILFELSLLHDRIHIRCIQLLQCLERMYQWDMVDMAHRLMNKYPVSRMYIECLMILQVLLFLVRMERIRMIHRLSRLYCWDTIDRIHSMLRKSLLDR